ncbi:MAG: hypothetical protein AAF986_01770, partial [Pseudomonadota bacterium]
MTAEDDSVLKNLFGNDGGSGEFPLEESAARYNQWQAVARSRGLIRQEWLIPQHSVSTPRAYPDLMTLRDHMGDDEKQRMCNEVEALAPWGYTIHLADGIWTEESYLQERFLYRAHLIGQAVRDLAGGAFSDCSVLDMACNHGYFAIQAAADGAGSALGIDLREGNIRKAE